MADAVPNLADTITATISAIDSITASEQLSTMSPVISFPAPSADTTAITPPVATELTPSPTTYTTAYAPSTAISDGFSTSETLSFDVPTIGATLSTPITSATSANSRTSAVDSTLKTETRTSVSQTSTSSTATSVAVNAPAEKTSLSTSAIAGITTASVVIIALVLGYLAYLFMVKCKAKSNRTTQRFSSFFPPIDNNDGSAGAPIVATEKDRPIPEPDRPFYDGETEASKRFSFRRESAIAPSNIGVAVAHSTPIRRAKGKGPGSLSLFPVQTSARREYPQPGKWSAVSSFDEDVEAQTQDLPILANSKSRSSARSVSSAGISRPAPLRLSKVKASSEQKGRSRIPLTPVYDNGNFELRVKGQFLNDSSLGQERSKPALSGQPRMRYSPHDSNRPFWSQNRRSDERFPIKIAATGGRKKSEVSMRSESIYTDIEEDDTPEKEEDKQLAVTMPAPLPNNRLPLRDLAWPQIPRSASIAKQAETPHSPRKNITLRVVNPTENEEHASRDIEQKPSLVGKLTSPTTIETQSSESPVFPMPPPRNPARLSARRNQELVRQISNAYKAASVPTTTLSPVKGAGQVPVDKNASTTLNRPGQTYQTIQWLSTGRPLDQKIARQPYLPQPLPIRSTSRAKVTPVAASNGDWYLKVGSLER